MAYQVFARKWRPQTFEDVVGQEHITETLKRAIQKNRVAHAYIFSGTRGVGKTTTARILAKALNCEQGPTPEPCGVCESCKAVLAGNSFDVMEIDGASNNSVEDIRELRENLSYTSMGGKHRIIVIDEVHMLSNSAFNALLKTLEEPPEKVIFILATTEPNKVIDTVKSRCQRFDFRAIPITAIAGQLKKICDTEGIVYDARSLELIATKANDSMRDGLSLLDQAYSFCGERLEESQVRSVLGLVETQVYRSVMLALKDGNTSKALRELDEVLRRGYDVEEFLVGFVEYMRTLLFLAIPGGTSTLSKELEPQYREISSLFSEGDLLRFSEILSSAEGELKFSSMPRFVVERLLVKMALMERTISTEQLIELAKGGSLGEVMPARVPAPKAPEVAPVQENRPPTVSQPVVHMPEEEEPPVVLEPQAPLETPEPPMPSIATLAAESEAPAVSNEASSVYDELEKTLVEPTPDPKEPPRDISKNPIADWSVFTEQLASRRQMLSVQLQSGTPSKIRDNGLLLTLPHGRDFVLQQLELEKNTVEEELFNFSGTPWVFSVACAPEVAPVEVEKEEEPEEEPIVEEEVTPPNLEEDIENEPIIQKVIEIFNGEVLS